MHYELENVLHKRKATLKVSTKDAAEENPLDPESVSLFCLRHDNAFRLFNHRIAESKLFQNTILILIIISTITLALETPLDDPKGQKVEILEKIDFGMTAIFTLEAIIKIIAVGFAFAGK